MRELRKYIDDKTQKDAGAGVQGQLMRKKALEHGQKLLEKDVRWKESLTKAVEKVESA